MKQLVSVLLFLWVVGLSAQRPAQVDYYSTVALSDAFVHTAIQSEGSLALFNVVVSDSAIVIIRTIVSSEGIMSPADTVFTYSGAAPWTGSLPVFYNGTTKYNFTYITLKNYANIFIIRIPDLALDTLPDVHVFENQGILTAQIPNLFAIHTSSRVFYIASPFICTHTLDLETDTQTSYPYQSMMSFLGTDYLVIYWTEGQTRHYQMIDEQGNVTTPYVSGQTFGSISAVSPDIGGGIYIAKWSIDDNLYGGFITHEDNYMGVVVLENGTMVNETIPIDVIPISYQRFVCRMAGNTSGYDFRTCEMVDGDFEEYTGFPNLNLHELENYASRLFRMDDRYIVGVYTNTPSNRKLICIDLQDQTMIESIYPLATGTSEHSYKVIYGGENIYYTRAGEVVIYKITPTTGNADNQAAPPAITLSAYPNPFRDKTTFRLSNLKAGISIANVYNLKGQLVKTLAWSSPTNTEQTVEWDGTNNARKPVGQGVYYLKASDDIGSKVKKLLKLK